MPWWVSVVWFVIKIIGSVIFLVYVLGLVRIVYIEHNIKLLQEKRDKEIGSLKGQGRGITAQILQRQEEKIKLEYNLKIEKLERDRRYILGKLPFVKSN